MTRFPRRNTQHTLLSNILDSWKPIVSTTAKDTKEWKEEFRHGKPDNLSRNNGPPLRSLYSTIVCGRIQQITRVWPNEKLPYEIQNMWFGFFDLVDLWVIEIKTSVILCARGASGSREQNRKHRSRSENMPKMSLLYSQHNKIVWLSNMADTIWEKFTRCAKFCGLFFSRTLIGWAGKLWSRGSNGPGKLKKFETAWSRELMTDPAVAWTKGRVKQQYQSGGI